MALSRVKTWTAEVLTASDLNAEFNNIINNALSLISPLTGTLDLDNNRLDDIHAGSVSDTSLNPNGDGNTGIYFPAADQAAWAVGGNQAVLYTTSKAHFNDEGDDMDHIIEGDTNATLFNLDAGQDAISFGGANVDGAATIFNNLTDRTAVTSVGAQIHVPAQTQNFDNGSGTIAIGAAHFFGIPTWTGDTATLTMTNAANVYIQGAPVASTNVTHTTTGYSLWVDAGDTRLDGDLILNGTRELFLNETSNANGTICVTVNQGGNSDQFFCGKNSGVTNGHTDTAEADTHYAVKTLSGSAGGFILQGFSSAWNAMYIEGYVDATDAVDTDTSSSSAVVLFRIFEDDGSNGRQNVTTGNIFGIRNGSSTTRLILKEDGELHLGVGGVSPTDMDELDDVHLTRALMLQQNPSRKGIIDTQWDRFVKYNERDLIEAGILGKYDPGVNEPLLCMTQLARLHNGAIFQLYCQHMDSREEYKKEIADLKNRLEITERNLLDGSN